jgi:arginyl-tRNA synthetase
MTQPIQIIREAIQRALGELGTLAPETIGVERPRDEANGDYSSNIALAIFSKHQTWAQISNHKFSNSQMNSPREVAEKIVTLLQNDTQISSVIDTTRISVAGPGFINFWLTKEYLGSQLAAALQSTYGRDERHSGKKIMVEYTDPNPFKELHIGHLMSNTIGESLARLMEMQGAAVTRANYQGDVGLHVAKAVWGLLGIITNHQTPITKHVEQDQIVTWIAEWEGKPLTERQRMMGQAYAAGATAYEEDEAAKAEMHELNKQIYDELKVGAEQTGLMALYQAGRRWSLEYFETIYARLGTHFDEYFFESEAGYVGLQVVEDALKRGILEMGENGAVVYKGEKEGLHTRVFRNALGLATYEGKELGLAKTKYERVPYDLSYIVTANEITEYFKVLLSVLRQLYPDLAAKTTHVPHGVMKLTTGKMSSRTGKVVTGEGLLNELQAVVTAKMNETEEMKARKVKDAARVADQIAVGALKYTVLKQQLGGDIVYDPAKMTNLEGDTGPYIQYTYARARSVIKRANNQIPIIKHQTDWMLDVGDWVLNEEEFAVLRTLARYPEVVAQAGAELAPHLVAGYVYELAARFNTFYNKHQILPKEEFEKQDSSSKIQEIFRLQLTQAVANVIQSGLEVLGIAAPAEM